MNAQKLNLLGSNPIGKFELSDIRTIAELRTIDTGTTNPDLVVIYPNLEDRSFARVSGYYSENDGGGGVFIFDSQSTTADDGGSVIAPTNGRGRWIRQIPPGLVSVKLFGAKGDGVTNDTTALQAATAYSNRLYFPAGTYLCGSPAGDYVFSLGNRSGLEFAGDGPLSILKLGNAIGRSKSMFGSGNAQTLSNVYIHDLKVDLNGANNLQTSFSDPLRYNCFCYFFSANIRNIVIERVQVFNASGSQVIRIANDTANVADNVVIRDCYFYNFGIAIPGNLSEDQSVLYLYGRVSVENCKFENPVFVMNPAKGATAIEYHDGSGSRFVGNTFVNVQLPFLCIASTAETNGTEFVGNKMIDCGYFLILDGPCAFATRGVLIADNYFRSSQEINPALIWIGKPTDDGATVRTGIRIMRNHIETTSEVQGRIGVFFNASKYTDVLIDGNTFAQLKAPAISLQGPVGDTGKSSLVITNNVFDSCCSTAAGAPVFPVDGASPQVLISTANTNAFRSIVIQNNTFLNSTAKDFTYWKQVYLGANVRAEIIAMRLNTKAGDATTPLENDAGCAATRVLDKTLNLTV